MYTSASNQETKGTVGELSTVGAVGELSEESGCLPHPADKDTADHGRAFLVDSVAGDVVGPVVLFRNLVELGRLDPLEAGLVVSLRDGVLTTVEACPLAHGLFPDNGGLLGDGLHDGEQQVQQFRLDALVKQRRQAGEVVLVGV